MSKQYKVVCLPGDGIGPEVVAEAVKVLKTVAAARPDVKFELQDQLFGGAAIDATGNPLPDETLKACKESDAIILGSSADDL